MKIQRIKKEASDGGEGVENHTSSHVGVHVMSQMRKKEKLWIHEYFIEMWGAYVDYIWFSVFSDSCHSKLPNSALPWGSMDVQGIENFEIYFQRLNMIHKSRKKVYHASN